MGNFREEGRRVMAVRVVQGDGPRPWRNRPLLGAMFGVAMGGRRGKGRVALVGHGARRSRVPACILIQPLLTSSRHIGEEITGIPKRRV